MRLLLDTHILVWCATDDPLLSRATRRAIIETSTETYVSAATAWEISVKAALGKLRLPRDPVEWFPEALATLEIKALPIIPEHALAAGALPLRHRDPFDRMLIAQARHEGLTLVTVDPVFKAYDVPLIFG